MSRTTNRMVQRGGIRIDGVKRSGMSMWDAAPTENVPRSTFNLSHQHKTSFEMGRLIPILCKEMLPGSTYKMSAEAFLRLAPMIAPIMDNVDIQISSFFVPERILYTSQDQWKFHIMGRSGDANNAGDPVPTWGYCEFGQNDIPVSSLGNYLGLRTPTATGRDFRVKASPLAAYCKIYDDYYRAKYVQAGAFQTVDLSARNAYYEAVAAATPLRIGKMHDYFTTCLPNPQVGEPVLIPLVANPVPVTMTIPPTGDSGDFVDATTLTHITGAIANAAGGVQVAGTDAIYNPNGTLQVNPNDYAASIIDLRIAIQIQAYFEQMARNGSDFNEWLLSMFAVQSEDSRLQRAEYVDTTSTRMVISQVLATTAATDQPLGTFAGHGVSYGGGNMHYYEAKEHGYFMVLISVAPETSYFNGIERMWSRETWYDYPIPMFGSVSEMEVKRKELNIDIPLDEQEETFGYQLKDADFKFANSRISGQFQTTLNYWHMAQIFEPDETPTLDSAFILQDPTTRIFAVEEPESIFGVIYFNIQASHPLPRFSVPRIQ